MLQKVCSNIIPVIKKNLTIKYPYFIYLVRFQIKCIKIANNFAANILSDVFFWANVINDVATVPKSGINSPSEQKCDLANQFAAVRFGGVLLLSFATFLLNNHC